MSAINHKRTIVFPIPPSGKTNGVCLGRRRWRRRRPLAAPRWTGAGAGSIGSWPGPGGAWRGHRLSLAGFQSAPFELSDSIQGHTRLQARGGGLWGGYPPVAVFAGRGAPRKTIDGWLTRFASTRANDVRPAIDGRYSASLVTPVLPEHLSLSERLD